MLSRRGYALRYRSTNAPLGRATAIGRRSPGISNRKLREVSHKDIGDCSVLAEVFSDDPPKEVDRSDHFDCLDLFFSLFSKQAASTRYARNFVIAEMPGTFSD